MSKKLTLTEQRANLQADYDAASEEMSREFDRKLRKRTEAPAEVLAPLVDFRAAIDNKRPDAVPLDERTNRQRELTRELFESIEERGLLLTPVRSQEGWALGVTDPNIDAAYEAALAGKNDALTAIRDFERDHGEDLKAEQRKAEADSIREAFAGDDPDAIRAAINGQADVLTSADVAPTRQRVTTAG